MDFANKENEEELDGEENDVEEAMLEGLAEDDEVGLEEEELLAAEVPAETPSEDEEDEDEDSAEDEGLFEEDAEDVDFDSFDDEDHL